MDTRNLTEAQAKDLIRAERKVQLRYPYPGMILGWQYMTLGLNGECLTCRTNPGTFDAMITSELSKGATLICD